MVKKSADNQKSEPKDGSQAGKPTAVASSPKSWFERLCEPQIETPEGYIQLSGPLEHDSIVNGPGLRAVVWTQGCRQHCPGCQNVETWAEEGGMLVKIDKVKEELAKLKGQSGLTFCGGEPLLQAKACLEIAKYAKEELSMNIWSFSGLVYEKIPRNSVAWEFVKYLDALIDGPFILAERDLTMKFRGSRNQRILHLKNGEIQSIE